MPDETPDQADRREGRAVSTNFAGEPRPEADYQLMFLIDRSLPATNYRAEQALRPAVVNRKVWGGNRTEAGAEAQKGILSVLGTCKQQLLSGFTSQPVCPAPGRRRSEPPPR
jgi:hypothetical protein